MRTNVHNGPICVVSCVFLLGLILIGPVNAADPSLVAWWMFDEAYGTVAGDSSGNGNNGSCKGTLRWEGGVIGSALQFDGKSYVEVPDSPSLDITEGITIAAWVQPQATGVARWIIAKNTWGPTQTYGLVLSATGNIEWDISDGTTWILRKTLEAINNGAWSHVAAQYSPPVMRVFINGELSQEWNIGSYSINTNDQNLLIGQTRGQQFYSGLLDDVRIYNRALSVDEIIGVFEWDGDLENSSNPIPGNGATDVSRDVVLSWKPGSLTAPTDGHIVYFDESVDVVNGAVGGTVQTDAIYVPPQRLDFGKTYYWRVDEASPAPDSTVYPGQIWSFTVEPFAYPIAGGSILATASGSNSLAEGPENTINGDGLDPNDLHSVEYTDMWLSNVSEPQAAWIQYQFDKAYKLHEMWIWNHNSMAEADIGYGVKDAIIEYSTDGVNWATLGTTHEFARATGASDYTHNTTVDFGGVTAKFVKLTVQSNWGGLLSKYGLSEIRFLYVPMSAREPQPATGATDVAPQLALSWRAGREAASHLVYLSTEQQAVANETAPVVSVSAMPYEEAVDLSSTYYWKVVEVNEAEEPSAWIGDVWSFSTAKYLVVDDMESYKNLPFYEIWATWLDGTEFGMKDPTNGSIVGLDPAMGDYDAAPGQGGGQSLPIWFSNTATAPKSEVTRTFESTQDWTKHSIDTLVIYFQGNPDNAPASLYVKINDTKVVYDNGAAATTAEQWTQWNIPLAATGANLKSVTSLTIGVSGGGGGTLFIDDIRLEAQATAPVGPGAGLVMHLGFDEGSGTVAGDLSGNENNGSFKGDPQWVTGKIGGALSFDGVDDSVEVPDSPSLDTADAITMAAWVKPESTGTNRWLIAKDTWGAGEAYGLNVWNNGRIEFGISTDGTKWVPKTSGQSINDGVWSHVVAQYSSPYIRIFINGEFSQEWDVGAHVINTNDSNLLIGAQSRGVQWYSGLVDDIRIYNRALSTEEIKRLFDSDGQ